MIPSITQTTGTRGVRAVLFPPTMPEPLRFAGSGYIGLGKQIAEDWSYEVNPALVDELQADRWRNQDGLEASVVPFPDGSGWTGLAVKLGPRAWAPLDTYYPVRGRSQKGSAATSSSGPPPSIQPLVELTRPIAAVPIESGGYPGGARTMDFQDANRNGVDDRDERRPLPTVTAPAGTPADGVPAPAAPDGDEQRRKWLLAGVALLVVAAIWFSKRGG